MVKVAGEREKAAKGHSGSIVFTDYRSASGNGPETAGELEGYLREAATRSIEATGEVDLEERELVITKTASLSSLI